MPRRRASRGGITKKGLSADIASWIADTQDKADAIVVDTLGQMAQSLVDLTPAGDPAEWKHKWEAPKGYTGGRLKANWQFGIRQRPGGVTGSVDPDGSATVADLQGQIADTVLGDTCYFVNNAPYALIVEYGWSKQTPAGMARLTIETWDQFLRAAVDNVS